MILFERNSYLALPVLIALCLGSSASAQVDILTQHNDPQRSGANLKETKLNTTNVKNGFRKLCFRLVDGDVYAQPLLASNVAIAGQPNPRNVVLVATENNSVYAFDADDTNQASTTFQLWKSAQLGPAVPSELLSQFLKNAPAACVDLTPQIGITSTPVISPDKQTVYVVAKTLVSTAPFKTATFLHALKMSDGSPRQAPVLIEGDVPGSASDAKGGIVTFDSNRQLQRSALLLTGGVLYVAFAGHCDSPPFHGWIFTYDALTLKKIDVFNTTPNEVTGENNGEGGIWQSGQGPAVDEAGNIYVSTGNGSNNATKPGGANTDFGDSVLKLKLDAARKLVPVDWFTPMNQALLNKDDADLGSSGPLLVPSSHLIVAGGKEGRLFLIDRDQMGKGQKPSLHSIQVTNAPVNSGGPNPIYWNIHGSPIAWKQGNKISIYVCGEEDKLKQFTLIPDTGPAGWKFAGDVPVSSRESAPIPNFPFGDISPNRREPVIMPGGMLSISANGDQDGTGVLWVSMPLAASANQRVVAGILRAYDASNVGLTELWDSERNPNDSIGMFAKFVPPTVANGKVYIPAFGEEIIEANGVHKPRPGGLQPALAIYGVP